MMATGDTATSKLELIMGRDGLARLADSTVMVLGVGGVGSNCVEALARGGGKVLSIHAVKAAGEALDVLERAGALAGNACIFHWF